MSNEKKGEIIAKIVEILAENKKKILEVQLDWEGMHFYDEWVVYERDFERIAEKILEEIKKYF